MKKLLIVILGSLCLASNVQADIIYSDDLLPDNLVDQALLSNSGNEEQAWLEGIFGVGYGFAQLSDSAGEDGNWLEVLNEAPSQDLWAWDFVDDGPHHFVIKVGNHVSLNGSSEVFSHYLFENIASAQYGVIDLNLFDRTNNGRVSIGVVSHVASVPEPTLLALMGAGLVGLGIARRRRSIQA